MMRLLLLCLLLLPTATAYSNMDRDEGSGDEFSDDEELYPGKPRYNSPESPDRATGEDSESDQITMIIIVVAVVALALSVAAVIAIILVRRHRNKQPQGIYSVPIDQDTKEAV